MWLRRSRCEGRVSLRLVCLPHAGGTAASYAGWRRRLPATVELIAVQYPGRQDRLSEAPIEDMSELAHHVVAALRPLLDVPVALFGHSLGSALGYEVASRLERELGFRAAHLFASARPAPHRAAGEPQSMLGDEELISAMRRLGGTHASVYDHPQLMPFVLPALRADLTLIGRYRPHRVIPLSTPITAFGGDSDSSCPVAALSTWREATTGGARVRVFSGGHHYIRECEGDVVAAITEELGVRKA
jgi:surfactin synthase thioesterase subunit